MIFELRNGIETKLNSLLGEDGTSIFANIYNYHTLKKEGFPYCTFELSDFEGRFLDSCTNARIFKFNVVVVNVVNSDYPREDVVRILYKCLEKIIEAFDGDMDLSVSQIVKGEVSTGEIGMIIEGEGQTMAMNINIALTTTTIAHQ